MLPSGVARRLVLTRMSLTVDPPPFFSGQIQKASTLLARARFQTAAAAGVKWITSVGCPAPMTAALGARVTDINTPFDWPR